MASLSAISLFSEVLDGYLVEVTATLRSKREDTFRLRALQRRWIVQLRLEELTSEQLGKYCNERLKVVGAGTVLRKLAYFPSIINHARFEWGLQMENPIKRIRKPIAPPGRNRILTDAEIERLFCAAEPSIKSSNPYLPYILKFAYESAMGWGEILEMRWSVVNLNIRTVHLPLTKNGTSRIVPLSKTSIFMTCAIWRSPDSPRNCQTLLSLPPFQGTRA